VLTATGLALTLSVALAGLLEREVARRRTESQVAAAPGGVTAELGERWRATLLADIIRTRTGDGGQLAKMVRQGDPIELKAVRVDLDAGRPRVRVDGRLLPWSEITRRWEAASGRLVILGDPGYGKTVAALTLLKHINAHSQPGDSVAELFSLSEWQRWRGEHQTAPFGDWLVAQLTIMHPQLMVDVAQELVDAGLVLPVLDGLDEIATVEHRRACIDAIDAYAERGSPHRPFVLTCRAREYYELAPDWVRDDERVVLVGLQPEQIRDKLAEPQIAGRPAWRALREHQAAGGSAIDELFRSPLRLAIALQVYRDHDPSELLTLSLAQARGRLWELLLANNADGYRNATATQVRAWLAWLAAGMRHTSRQRFMLHELYLLDPQSAKHFRVFQILIGLVVGLAVGLSVGLDIGAVAGLVGGLVGGLGAGLGAGLLIRLNLSPRPSVPTPIGWRARLQSATTKDQVRTMLRVALVLGLFYGLFFELVVGLSEPVFGLDIRLDIGLGAGLVGGLGAGLFGGLFGGLVAELLKVVWALIKGEVVATDPPRRFADAAPDVVLFASRSNGLLAGLVGGLVGGLVAGWSSPAFVDT
jgi:hypothetical protein